MYIIAFHLQKANPRKGLILYFLISVGKDSERREQRQTENEVFRFGHAEPRPILGKYRERQVQKQTELSFQG